MCDIIYDGDKFVFHGKQYRFVKIYYLEKNSN